MTQARPTAPAFRRGLFFHEAERELSVVAFVAQKIRPRCFAFYKTNLRQLARLKQIIMKRAENARSHRVNDPQRFEPNLSSNAAVAHAIKPSTGLLLQRFMQIGLAGHGTPLPDGLFRDPNAEPADRKEEWTEQSNFNKSENEPRCSKFNLGISQGRRAYNPRMARAPLIISTDCGLYCPAGDFHIDAWKPVARNVVTHAHSDHARRGSERYLVPIDGVAVLKRRLGEEITVDGLEYGRPISIKGVAVSLHPAGHLLGSAQVRIEYDGEVWVFTGDYKTEADPTCRPFELVKCHTFITECTFGLPIFCWRPSFEIAGDINAWWRQNVEQGRTSILLAYSLGKAQCALAMLDPSIGPILLHGAVHAMTETYRASGVALPPALYADAENAKAHKGRAMVIAPPGAEGGPWIRKFHPESVAVASGWMQIRGNRRRQAVDRGFVLSDHVDWPSLQQTIAETGAQHIIATHGYTGPLVRYLREGGKSAEEFSTRFEGEGETDAVERPTDEREGSILPD